MPNRAARRVHKVSAQHALALAACNGRPPPSNQRASPTTRAAESPLLHAALVVIGFSHHVWRDGGHSIRLDLPLLIEAAFCAASCMIAFGAVLGKTTPTELIWLITAMVRPRLCLRRRAVLVPSRRNRPRVANSAGLPCLGLRFAALALCVRGVGARAPYLLPLSCSLMPSSRRQVPLYGLNQYLVMNIMQAVDVGGSITIHA